MSVIIRSKITIDPDPGDISKRGWNRIMRAVFQKVGQWWHKHHLPRHFKDGNLAKYKMKPRSKEWRERKRALARKGIAAAPDTPLKFRGDLERMMTRAKVVKAFPTRATINLPGPRYLKSRPAPSSNRPDMAGEILAVAKDEVATLDKIAERELDRQIKNYHSRKVVKT